MNSRFRNFLYVLLVLIFTVSSAMVISDLMQKRQAEETYEMAEHLAAESLADSTEESASSEAVPFLPVWRPAPLDDDDPFLAELSGRNLNALQDVNPQVLGWIEIPDSPLAYPVMDGEDNDYYLNHTWDNEESIAGSVFLEQKNASDLGDYHTILYGHRMMDGSMFGSLKHYERDEYVSSHPYIYLLDENGAYRYEIFAAYHAAVDSPTFTYGFRSDAAIQTFLDHCTASSVIETGVIPGPDDRILTLVTCTGSGYEERWVVQARCKGVEGNPVRYYRE